MKRNPDPGGDVPIRLAELQFTLSEAAFLSGVPMPSIRNWQGRAVMAVGAQHFTGRWMFSILDVLTLCVMRDFCVSQTHSPKLAALVAGFVVQVAMESTVRDASGRLLEGADGFRPNRNVILTFDENGAPFVCVADIKQPGSYYPPAHGDVANAALRRSHVVVPATALLHDVLLRTEELTRRNVRAEAPTHV